NPDVPLDTNHLEREIRPVALGRKKLAVLLDGSGRASGRDHLQFASVVSSPRRRSLCLSGRCPATRRYPSGPGRASPHPPSVEAALRCQPPAFGSGSPASITSIAHRLHKETVQHEIAAWERQRNDVKATVQWRFTMDKARTKLQRLYPSQPICEVLAIHTMAA